MKYNYTTIKQNEKWIIRRTHYENLCIFDEYFAGYSFMGCANWTDSILSSRIQEQNSEEEANDIIRDLKAADDPEEPTTAKRINAGYEIVRSLQLDATHELVIGKHPTAPATYVVWDCTNGNNYNNGGYCSTFRQALYIIAERITSRYDFLPMEA